jgi:hypothetical protein
MAYPVYDNLNSSRQSFSYGAPPDVHLSRRRSRGRRSSVDYHNPSRLPNLLDAHEGLVYDNSMRGPPLSAGFNGEVCPSFALSFDPSLMPPCFQTYRQPSYQIYDSRDQQLQGEGLFASIAMCSFSDI